VETKFQTSFIPKTTIQTPTTPAFRKSKSPGILVSFCFLILLVSLLFAVLSFGYLSFLENTKKTMDEQLKANIEKFEKRTLEEYARLDTRIETATLLINTHIAPSYFLEFLQAETLKSVKFTNLKYELSADGSYASVSMTGVAKSYNAIAFQSNVFGNFKDLTTPIFSNLDLDLLGNVTFAFTSRINSSFIYYKNKAEEFKQRSQGVVSTDAQPKTESTDAALMGDVDSLLQDIDLTDLSQ
jgi:hypothetical protein